MKLQTAVLVAMSSGVRIGELVQLRISDVDFSQKPTKIRIRTEITKKKSRETYLTTEATSSLKDYITTFFGWKDGQIDESMKDKIILDVPHTLNNQKAQESPSYIMENTLTSFTGNADELLIVSIYREGYLIIKSKELMRNS